MAAVGIVAEYNPFHKGHAYQMDKARAQFGADTPIVVVMSGPFVQRGEPAIASKWVRTQIALLSGVDLVIELPFTFACASAERFARGAIGTLDATGVVSDLYFGSECDDLALLCCVVEEYDEENPEYIALLREHLRSGKSYAKARELAVGTYFRQAGHGELAEASAQIMSMPNSILALEYLIAIKRLGTQIRPAALLRQGASYRDCSTDAQMMSATGIRKLIEDVISIPSYRISDLADALIGRLPDLCLAVLLSEWQQGILPVTSASLIGEQILRIRADSPEALQKYAHMGDRLPWRLRNAVARLRDVPHAELLHAFREEAETKRYAPARIFRAMTALLVGQLEKDLSELTLPEYIRVLGFSDTGRNLLRTMRKTCTLPIIDKASDFLSHGGNANLTRMAELDRIASNLWGLKAGLRYGDEFERSVIRLTAGQTRRRNKNENPLE